MFRFRFEQILNVRKLAEEQVMQEFSEQMRGLEREKEHLRSIRGEKAGVLAELMRRQAGASGSVRWPRWSWSRTG
jgi:flagellar biosynthesis chaperone FliJ